MITKKDSDTIQSDRRYVADACSYFTRSSNTPSMLKRRSLGWILNEIHKNLNGYVEEGDFYMDKKMLIHAIIGKGFGGSHSFALDMTNRGLAVFTGNQHNEDWSWNMDGLEALSIEELTALYKHDA